MAAASKVLEENGYQRVPTERLGQWATTNARVFEDDYGIVAVVAFETWADLAENWPDSQGGLVELMSRYMSSEDAKAWEGYLVLLTPSMPGPAVQLEINRIRYDTNRVRKLVATGDELTSLSEVERALLPLLPLQVATASILAESVLDLLPMLLSRRGIPEDMTDAAIRAYREQQPIMERLHRHRGQS